jgi:ubiquinone biosynthesis monooxygenase Coq7
MKDKDLKRILRVNQAGEYGATRIYAGQLAVLKNNEPLKEMANQEADHLKIFNQLLIKHKVQPTIFQPVWHVGAYALGMITALMGEKAAHACTIAVETVIDEHYRQQLQELEQEADHQEVRGVIYHCHQDELHHQQTAIEQGGEQAPAFAVINTVVQSISKAAIWLSSRI